MDIEITKMFQEKNKDIFKNSLGLEMERNLESLKKTTDNCTALELNKIFNFLKSLFEEHGIIYNENDLKTEIEKEKEKLNEIVNSRIDIKMKNLNTFFQKRKTDSLISEEYLNEYYEELSKNTTDIVGEIEKELKKEICIEFTPNLLKKYKLNTQDQQDRVTSRIDMLFSDTLIRRVKEQISFRDKSLENMSRESFEKYKKLNERTLEK